MSKRLVKSSATGPPRGGFFLIKEKHENLYLR
nr:MAG TPA: hypothetical protein [Caudoviricetes sp.]DAW29290.1 MAG TPA: hypothetical protein [Caudoviricetes sp.]